MNPRLIAWLSCAAAAAMVLGGCVQSNPRTINTPAPVITPMFASDAEALAAATDAYAAYVRVSDEIFMEGGVDPKRLSSVAIGDQLESNLAGFGEAERQNLRSTGGTKFDSVSLQSFDPQAPNGIQVVSLYLCEDLTNVNVLNSAGESVVTPRRPIRAGYRATFDQANPAHPEDLLIASKTLWPNLKC